MLAQSGLSSADRAVTNLGGSHSFPLLCSMYRLHVAPGGGSTPLLWPAARAVGGSFREHPVGNEVERGAVFARAEHIANHFRIFAEV